MTAPTHVVIQEPIYRAARTTGKENYKMKYLPKLAPFAAAGMALILVLLAASPASAAKPPRGRTYFLVSAGLATDSSEAYAVNVGCVFFTATDICQIDAAGEEECGSWQRTATGKQASKQGSFEFQFSFIDDETGLPIEVDGQGRIDARGKKSSIAGVARGFEETSATKINFAIAGRAVRRARCAQLVEEFEAENQ